MRNEKCEMWNENKETNTWKFQLIFWKFGADFPFYYKNSVYCLCPQTGSGSVTQFLCFQNAQSIPTYPSVLPYSFAWGSRGPPTGQFRCNEILASVFLEWPITFTWLQIADLGYLSYYYYFLISKIRKAIVSPQDCYCNWMM